MICYYPGGREVDDDSGYQPCEDYETTFSTCCIQTDKEHDICHPNGLCYFPEKQYYYRGTCTNNDWENCPELCLETEPDRNNTYIPARQCDTGEWCCNLEVNKNKETCCKEPDSPRFSLGIPSLTVPAATSSSNAGPSSIQHEQPTVTVTRGPTDDGGLSDGAKGAIGGSIGGVAAIALGIGVAWWILRRQRAGRTQEEAETVNATGDKNSDTETRVMPPEVDSRSVSQIYEMGSR